MSIAFSRKRARQLWRPDLFACIMLLIIIVGSLMPAEEARAMPGNDLFQHLSLYGLLSFFSLLAWAKSVRFTALIMISILSLGAAIEYAQPFVGRTFDLSDMAANSAGIIAGGVLVFCVSLWRRHKLA